MFEALADGHADAIAFGRHRAGDKKPKNQDDLFLARGKADNENHWLKKFEQDINDGKYTNEDGTLNGRRIKWRASLYSKKLRGSANEAFVNSSDPDDLFEWHLSPAEHCPDCLDFAKYSPYYPIELPSYPGDGDTACLVNCKCFLVRKRDGKQGVLPGAADVAEEEPEGDDPIPKGALNMEDIDQNDNEAVFQFIEQARNLPRVDLGNVRQLSAVKNYTDKGYAHVNPALRDQRDFTATEGRLIRHLDAAINATKLERPIVTFRGDGTRLSKLGVGDRFIDNAFCSTSVNRAKAVIFGRRGDEATILRIISMPGDRALWVDDVSSHTVELEVILPRNSEFEVISVDDVLQDYHGREIKVKRVTVKRLGP